MPTIRVNGYGGVKIQAIKTLRTHFPQFGLREAKRIFDDVDQFGVATFEVNTYPGAKLSFLSREGDIDAEVLDNDKGKEVERLTVYLKEAPRGVDSVQEFVNPQECFYQEGVLRVVMSDEKEAHTIPIHNILYVTSTTEEA